MSAATATPSSEQSVAAEVALAESLARVVELEHERDEYKKLYMLVREENERLKRGLLGQKQSDCRRATRSFRWPCSA